MHQVSGQQSEGPWEEAPRWSPGARPRLSPPSTVLPSAQEVTFLQGSGGGETPSLSPHDAELALSSPQPPPLPSTWRRCSRAVSWAEVLLWGQSPTSSIPPFAHPLCPLAPLEPGGLESYKLPGSNRAGEQASVLCSK